eukprot:6258485-Pyramimonas_sp.AAC.1
MQCPCRAPGVITGIVNREPQTIQRICHEASEGAFVTAEIGATSRWKSESALSIRSAISISPHTLARIHTVKDMGGSGHTPRTR